MHRKLQPYLSLVLTAIFLITLLTPLGDVVQLLGRALAATTVTDPVTAKFDVSTSTGQLIKDKYYSAKSSATGTLSIPQKYGYTIKSVTASNGAPITLSSDPKGLSRWDGSVSLLGVGQPVTSDHNDSTDGYWAWYRYTPNDPNYSNNWYADLDEPTKKVESGTSAAFDNVGGILMPQYPGYVGTVSLQANRTKDFSLGGDTVQPSAVDVSSISGLAETDGARSIDGPGGVNSGTPLPDYLVNPTVSSATDTDHFKVTVNADFSYLSDYRKQLGLPGAALMVYYYAFKVNLTGKTYEYPTTFNVTYEQVATGVNLTGTVQATDACFSPGTNQTMTYTIMNTGSQENVQPVSGKILANGIQVASFYETTITAGSSNSGTFSYTFTSTNSATFTVDIMPETGELNTDDNKRDFAIAASESCKKPCKDPNSPPIFTAGFVNHNNRGQLKPTDPAFPGDWLDLQIINDTGANPPTPRDPDGDSFTYTWDWNGAVQKSAWLKKYVDLYDMPYIHDDIYSFNYSMVLTEADIGTHSIDVYATDSCGQTSKRTASVTIMNPNPVPIITLPQKAVEGRTVWPPISGTSSFSPKDYKITSYDWHGTYSTWYATYGDYQIKLDVCDDHGLCSKAPDIKTLHVLYDFPPVAKLLNPGTGMRGNDMVFIDQSYSEDGDPIVEHTDTLKCDTNNNGSFDDDTSTTLTPDADGNLAYTPTQVGNCKIHIHIREGLGYKKSDDKDFFFTIENDNPTASFGVQGSYQPPALGLPVPITTDNLLSTSWGLVSLDGEMADPKPWYKTIAGSLRASPVMGNPQLVDGKSPLNGLDMTKPYNVYTSSNNPSSQTLSCTGCPIDSSWWNERMYANLPPYPYTDKYGLRLDSQSGVEGFISAKRIITNPYAATNPWYNVVSYIITKTVDGVQQWQITEKLYEGVGNAKANNYPNETIIAFTPDGQYFVYERNGIVVFRKTSNGSEYKTLNLGAVGYITGSYKNLMFFSKGSAYDFDGNHAWASSRPQCFSQRDVTYPSAKYVISKDGNMYCGWMYTYDARNSVGNTTHYHDVYFTQIDMNSGGIVGEKLLQQFSYSDNNDYYQDYSYIDHVNLVEDGGAVIGVASRRMSRSSNGRSARPIVFLRETFIKGSVVSNAKKEPYFTFGQFNNVNKKNQSGEYAYSFKFNSTTKLDEYAGFSFRMIDNLNFYRVEHNNNTTSLVSYVNGVRSVINSGSYPITTNRFYSAKIKASGMHIKVYINGALVIDAFDSSILSGGMYGPTTTKMLTEFQGIAVLDYPSRKNVANVIVVNNPILYTTNYSDPENDAIRTDSVKWNFTNEQPYVFLDAGDGYSDASPNNSYNNHLVTSPNATINKVGYFKLDYQIADDPSPSPYTYADGTFSSFSKYSDLYTQYTKVVRIPVAKFAVAKNPDNTLSYTDSSYDPDQWLSNTNFNLGYDVNRGIFDRRWKYEAPDGTVGFGFPSRPSQNGTYAISLAVMQEDGIWSDWYDQSVTAVTVPNKPPVATLTYPIGTQSSPTLVSSVSATIKWNQTDPDPDTTFGAFQVVVKDASGNEVVDSGIQAQATKSTMADWILDTSITMGQSYQVQARVYDGIAWSTWSNIGWFVTNRPPSAHMTSPSGTVTSPSIISTLRPTFVWAQSDPDAGAIFTYFELQVWDESNTTMLLTSGQHWQGTTSTHDSWSADSELPVRQNLRVRVRVYDGTAWSTWSPDTWFLINRPPIADFDWAPQPVWEGDALKITDFSFDPDGDTLTYEWSIQLPNGSNFKSHLKDMTSFPQVVPGTYNIILTVSDGITSASVTKRIFVTPLTISADVTHTPEWLNYHQQQGHETTTDPKGFYSGEKFIVRVVTAPAPVDEVVAWLDTTGKDGDSLQINSILSVTDSAYLYSAELFDPILQSLTGGLPDGIHTIHFRIRYANGVDKTHDIPIRIIGAVLETIGVHRRQ